MYDEKKCKTYPNFPRIVKTGFDLGFKKNNVNMRHKKTIPRIDTTNRRIINVIYISA